MPPRREPQTKGSERKYYQTTTNFNCGIDLHARQMHVCVVDRQGKKLLHQNTQNNDFAFFLRKIARWKHDLTVVRECLFCWYWLADACQAAGLEFVLAHALYLKAIHGGKNNNDRIDSEKLARLLAAYHDRLEAQKGSFKAHAIVANQLGRAIYFMLKNGTVFDLGQLLRHTRP